MRFLTLLIVACLVATCSAGPIQASRQEAEYYVRAYAEHYGIPLTFVRALIEQESGWRRCAVSSKGAVGLMQLMPATARTLGVQDRCNIQQNISGGVRYLAWLMRKFHGDLRLVAAAYYAGERPVGRRGLNYSNKEVIAYVTSIRAGMERERKARTNQVPEMTRRTR